jgi:ribosomal protein S18 acetylase RimI-like enzyme
MAQFRGEERILLFRSDRPGAIAKIVFSSEVPDENEYSKQPHQSQNAAAGVEPDVPAHSTAHAKIHVLDVKSQYRGRDLGGLLFSEAITSLKSKYCNDDDQDCDDVKAAAGDGGPIKRSKQVYDVECMLDAEEDVTRHGKLVSFYEHLGCRVKPTKRVQYVNNNDSETYRKVPMQIDLHPPKANSPSAQQRARSRRRKFSHLASSKGSFLPVQLVGSMGKLSVRSHTSFEVMKLDWLVTETPGGIQFCTTHGHLLMASPSGLVATLRLGAARRDFTEAGSEAMCPRAAAE